MIFDFSKKLNQAQKEAVEHIEGPLLIVAGAGTGKTTVLIERLNFLIKNNFAKPDEILLLTFMEKAALEMEERADKLLPIGYFDLWINTFHGFCEKILRQHAIEIGLPGDFKILNETGQWIMIKKNLYNFDLDYYRPIGRPTKFIQELIKHFSRLKDENINSLEYLDYVQNLELNHDKTINEIDVDLEIKKIKELANAYHFYNQLLLDSNYLDFGDLVFYTIKLFKERPNILKFYQNQFKFIMIDEFQDTNWSQYELIKILSFPKNNLVVVGDDDQAIYKFRGASLSNIMQFKDDYPNTKEIVLCENYRSDSNILNAAYNLITHNNPNRLEIKLGINKKLQAKSSIVNLPNKWQGFFYDNYFTEQDEIGGIVEKILNIYSSSKDAKWSDFAILIRSNNAADNFLNALTIAGIPNQFISLKGLYCKPIILDIIAYLKLLDNYHESTALFRVLNMDVFKVGHEDIININNFAQKKVWSLFEALQNIEIIPKISPESVISIRKLLSLIKNHSTIAQKNKTSQIFLEFVYDSGLIKSLDYDKDTITFDILDQFYRRIKIFEKEFPEGRLKDFMEILEMEFEAGDTGTLRFNFEDEEFVRIMTVHSAKGLEFKYVFIPNLVEKKFPVVNRQEQISIPGALIKEKIITNNSHYEEERRLFYVALTRAQQGLFLTSALDYGGESNRKISRFVKETGINFVSIDNNNNKKSKNNSFIKDLKISQKNKNTEKLKIKYKVPKEFSFSQFESYANCPLQYKFNFILKIPIPEKSSLIFGKLMHNILQDFLAIFTHETIKQLNLFPQKNQDNLSLPSFKELIKLYEKYWIDDGYRSKNEREKYKKIGYQALQLFYNNLKKEGIPQILFLEKNFVIKLDNYTIKGKIDRIDKRPDGSIEIIDYKTGTVKNKLKWDEKKQLVLYKIAMEEIFEIKTSLATFYYLNEGKKLSFEIKDEDVEKLKLFIKEQINLILQGDFTPKPGHLCSYCDFNSICEYRNK